MKTNKCSCFKLTKRRTKFVHLIKYFFLFKILILITFNNCFVLLFAAIGTIEVNWCTRKKIERKMISFGIYIFFFYEDSFELPLSTTFVSIEKY